MNELIPAIIVASILGAGLISGLLFAFSNFIMRALAELPSDKGMFAMQRINEKIINPIFMLFFLGTPVLCALIIISTLQNINATGSWYLLIGAIAYIIGPFGITMLFNVPLNNMLASADVSSAKEIWPRYQKRWQWWNHMRTYIGVAAIIFLAVGLGNIQPYQP
tara:strand:+ start:105365 stop:105856 length:492 start_codon:yes stop_codon:yes gene_type:complete